MHFARAVVNLTLRIEVLVEMSSGQPPIDDLDGADEAMRAWARRINERGGYGGRPVNTERGWTDRMTRLWARCDPGTRGTYTDRDLLEPLRRLGFRLRK